MEIQILDFSNAQNNIPLLVFNLFSHTAGTCKMALGTNYTFPQSIYLYLYRYTACIQLANKSSQRGLYIFTQCFVSPTHWLCPSSSLPPLLLPLSAVTHCSFPTPKSFVTLVVLVASVRTTVFSLVACK